MSLCYNIIWNSEISHIIDFYNMWYSLIIFSDDENNGESKKESFRSLRFRRDIFAEEESNDEFACVVIKRKYSDL